MKDILIFVAGMMAGATFAGFIIGTFAAFKRSEREHDLDERMGEE